MYKGKRERSEQKAPAKIGRGFLFDIIFFVNFKTLIEKIFKKASFKEGLFYIFFVALFLFFPFIKETFFHISFFSFFASIFLFWAFKRKQTLLIDLPTIFFSFFILSFFLSSLFSKTPYFSFAETFLMFSLFFIFLFCKDNNFLKKEFVLSLPYFSVFLTLMLSFFGLYFYLKSPQNFLFIPGGGWVSNPNLLAGFFLISFPFWFYYFFFSSGKEKFFFKITFPFVFSIFILTQTRGAYFSLILGLLLFLIYFKKKISLNSLLKGLIILFVSSLILASFFHFFKKEKSFFLSHKKTLSTLKTRLGMWKGAIKIWLDHFWFGTGPSSFSRVYPQYALSFLYFTLLPHSFYLKTLAELGIFGFLSFLGFLFSLAFVFSKFLKNVKNPTLEDDYTFCFFGGIFCVSIHALLSIILSNFPVFLYFSLFCALGLFFVSKNYPHFFPSFELSLSPIFLIFSFIFLLGFFYWTASYLIFFKGGTFFQKGDIKNSLATLEKGLSFNPNPDILEIKIKLSFLEKNYKIAQKNILKLRKVDPLNPFSYFMEGKMYFQQKDYKKAEKCFKKTIKINPYYFQSFLGLYEVYLKTSQNEKAKNVLDQVINKFDDETLSFLKSERGLYPVFAPQLKLIYQKRGEWEKKFGDPQKAEFFFRKAEELVN